MNIVKVIVEHSTGKIWGQSIITDHEGKESLSVKLYTGMKSSFTKATIVKKTNEMTIYDLRL